MKGAYAAAGRDYEPGPRTEDRPALIEHQEAEFLELEERDMALVDEWRRRDYRFGAELTFSYRPWANRLESEQAAEQQRRQDDERVRLEAQITRRPRVTPSAYISGKA